jgi:hypothetical protein
MRNTASNPDRAFTCNWGFIASGSKTVLEWIDGTSSFTLRNNTNHLWSIYDAVYFANIEYTEVFNETIDPVSGSGRGDCDYLFMGEMYEYTASYNNTNYFKFWFRDGGYDNITITYNYTSNELSINDLNDFIIGINDFTATERDTFLDVSIKFTLGKNIIDKDNVQFYSYHSNDTYNNTETLGIIKHIYNLGGAMSYEFINDAGKVTGGDVFEIYSQYNTSFSVADAESAYRRLQHVHIQASLDVEDNDVFDTKVNTGIYKFGIRICENNSWVDQYYCQIDIVNGAVDKGGVLSNGKAWIVYDVQWFAINASGVETQIKQDFVTAYPDCGDEVNNPVTTSKFWVDLWFSKYNYSTVIAGRFSPYYYGMDQTGFILWTDWSPIMFNETSSMFFYTNYDSNGNIRKTTDVEMVKVFARIETAVNTDTNLWSLRNYEIFDIETAHDRMSGIDTPVFEPVKVADMPSGGFVAPIVKAIQSIGNIIWSGALGFIKILIGAIDSLLQYVGIDVSLKIFIDIMNQWHLLIS